MPFAPGSLRATSLAFSTPALTSAIAYATTLQVGPIFLASLFAIAVRRALRTPAELPAALPARP